MRSFFVITGEKTSVLYFMFYYTVYSRSVWKPQFSPCLVVSGKASQVTTRINFGLKMLKRLTRWVLKLRSFCNLANYLCMVCFPSVCLSDQFLLCID